MTSVLLVFVLTALGSDLNTSSGFLLLRNGEVLQGHVTQAGDVYLVATGDGAELRIASKDVEMYCLDLDEAYVRKAAGIRPEDTTAHLRLADWCLCNGLLSRAADELLLVTAVEPDHPRLPLMERRLQMAVERPVSPPLVSQQLPALVSLDELERTARELPPDAMEAFAARVQPLLLNRCAANCCHGTRSESQLRLVRAASGRALTRRFTHRNLYAALQWVDRDDPQQSLLLTEPMGAHGSLAGPVFSEREREQYDLLAGWVRRVALAARVPAVERIDAREAALMQASYDEPVHLPRVGEQAAVDSRGPVPPALRAGTGHPSADPFDPEVFNRQFAAGPAGDSTPAIPPAENAPPARHRETPGYWTTGPAADATGPAAASGPTPLPPGWGSSPRPPAAPFPTRPATLPTR
jgi:hypothetical protein